jgi:hypothetical protein
MAAYRGLVGNARDTTLSIILLGAESVRVLFSSDRTIQSPSVIFNNHAGTRATRLIEEVDMGFSHYELLRIVDS